MQVGDYEYVGSILNLRVSKVVKIINIIQQKFDDGNLKMFKVLGKVNWGKKGIRENILYVKNRYNLD